MAVAHIASATMALTTGTTGGTIVIPASVATGHDLYVSIMSRGDAGSAVVTCVDDDTGGNTWTLVGVNPTTFNLYLFWKKATAGTASKTVTIANGLDSVTGGLSAFSGGLASGDPTTNLSFENNSSGNETHAGFTPTHADSMIRLVVANHGIIAVTLLACTNPGDLEPELWERSSTGGNDCSIISAARIQVGGPTATGNFTWAQTNAFGRSMVFAIQPQANTGAGASTLAGVTSAGAGTYTPAAITGTGASTLAGVTSAGTGVFTGVGPPPSSGGRRMGGTGAILKPPRPSR